VSKLQSMSKKETYENIQKHLVLLPAGLEAGSLPTSHPLSINRPGQPLLPEAAANTMSTESCLANQGIIENPIHLGRQPV
jgi:hypothetical protein